MKPPPNGHTLETYLKQAHQKMTTVAQRKFSRGDGQFMKGLRHTPLASKGICLHIVAETPGDSAPVLRKAKESKAEGAVGVEPAPPGSEWMDGDVFLYVRGDDVCICSNGLREGAATAYCCEMFRKATLPDDTCKFTLEKIANISKLKMIQAQGVKEIDLGASLYEATTKYGKRKSPQKLLHVLSRHLKALGMSDPVGSNENLMVGIVLRVNRRRKGRVVAEKQMGTLAKSVIADDEDYKIITNTGQIINKNEIFITKKVEMEKHSKVTV
jgi:hypothetical protein